MIIIYQVGKANSTIHMNQIWFEQRDKNHSFKKLSRIGHWYYGIDANILRAIISYILDYSIETTVLPIFLFIQFISKNIAVYHFGFLSSDIFEIIFRANIGNCNRAKLVQVQFTLFYFPSKLLNCLSKRPFLWIQNNFFI